MRGGKWQTAFETLSRVSGLEFQRSSAAYNRKRGLTDRLTGLVGKKLGIYVFTHE